jgi:hypothetical protein
MSSVRLYLAVHYAQSGGFSGGMDQMWQRDMPCVFPPGPGDQVCLWADPDDGHEGPAWDVKRRHYLANGQCCVELEPVQIDPDEAMQNLIMRSVAEGRPYRCPWWTDRDGDLGGLLTAGGWSRR